MNGRLALYCTTRHLEPRSRSGFGKDGTVRLSSAFTAIKVFGSPLPHQTERDAYPRLSSAAVQRIAGYVVPQLVGWDDQIGVVEMTVFRPPSVLDLAGASLDTAPDFPEDVLAEWLAEKREQFGDDWPSAAAVISGLARPGVHMLDVHPGSIRAMSLATITCVRGSRVAGRPWESRQPHQARASSSAPAAASTRRG